MKIDFNKLIKLTLVLAILVASFSLFYYYVIFLPQKEQIILEQQKQEQLVKEEKKQQILKQEQVRLEQEQLAKNLKKQLEQVKECRESGEKAYKNYKINNPGPDYVDGKFTFNKNLNTCLYSGGYFTKNAWTRFVKDSFTDETIITIWNFTDDKNENTIKKIDIFWRQHEELFNE